MSESARTAPFTKELANRSPWFLIAVLAHVVAVALAGIYYYDHGSPPDDDQPLAIALRSTAPPPSELPPPLIVDRNAVPQLQDLDAAPSDATFDPDGTDVPEHESAEADEGGGPPGPAAMVAFTPGSSAIGHGAGYRVPGPSTGHGPPGNSKYTKPGGPRGKPTRGPAGFDEAVDSGLAWLAAHQDADGRWDADGFMKHDTDGEPCTGPGNAANDIGVTGLALLAFLGRGHTLRDGQHRHVLRNGVRWLVEQQNPDTGLIGEPAAQSFLYSHAIAALALCEACGLSDHKPLRRQAQLAVNYIAMARNPYGVWRYEPKSGDGDTSVTAWMVQALLSARDFGLAVDDNALRSASVWFESVTDPATGTAGYTRAGEGSSRPVGKVDRFPASRTEALTGVVLLCRCLMHQDPKDVPTMDLATAAIAKKPPRWNEADGSIDMYYWYYASYALFQMGGKPWTQWSKQLGAAALPTQCRGGNARGSWDPIDPWGEDGGRVYSTALMVLCLEVTYRYARVLGGR